MRTIKKFEHKRVDRAVGRVHDWDMILSGQNVILDAGTDYERVGTGKDGQPFDRTDSFIATVKTKAADAGKRAKVTKIDAEGRPVTDPKADPATVTGIVVTATPMTPEELAERDAFRARAAEARARKAAEGANGAVEKAEPVAAVEPEPMS